MADPLAPHATRARRAADIVLLLSIAVALRGLGLARVERLLGAVPRRRSPSDTPAPRDTDEARELARRVEAAADRAPVPVRCLARSVCLRWLLERRGIEARLRIGAARERGAFRAHAWVESGAIVLGDDPQRVARFRAFDRPIGGPRS